MEQRSKSSKSYYNMPEPKAHADLLSRVDYNPETGEVTSRVNATTSRRRGQPVVKLQNRGGIGPGRPGRVRPIIRLSGISYLAHRLCWFYVHGTWPAGWLVPKDGDRINLRISNWELIPGDPADLAESGRLARERQLAAANTTEESKE